MTDACLGPQLSGWISSATLNHTKNVCDNIVVIRFAERPHMPSNFQVVCVHVSTTVYAQMAYRKETVMPVWRHNSPFVSRIQL